MEEQEKEERQDDALKDTEEQEEKGVWGPTTFQEMDEADDARRSRFEVMDLTERFLLLTRNVIDDPEIMDKGLAVISLAGEFASRVKTSVKETEETWMLPDLKAVWSSSFVSSLPDSSFLYVESGGKKEEGKTTPKSLRHLPYKDAGGKVDLPHVRNAISRLSQKATGTTGGKKWLTESLRTRLLTKARKVLKSEEKGLWNSVKGLLGFDDEQESFTHWKDQGVHYWMAVFTNNFRDDDHPPEILSAASHKEFVDAVDAEEWPMPELWLWHVKGTRWGEAISLAYDEDSGFTVAVGTIDEGKEAILDELASIPDLRVSHGMPNGTVVRDPDDPSVITSYRSQEISPLPGRAAANKNTDFRILKEDQMIPEHKRKFLEDIGVDVDSLETAMAEKKEELDAAGVESKEEKEEVVVETQEVVQSEVADDNTQLVALLQEAMAPLQAQIAELEKEVAEYKDRQEEDFYSLTPGLSIADLVKSSVIGKKETRLRANSKEASDEPKETDPGLVDSKSIGIPFIDAMRSGGDWRDGMKAQ